MKCKECNSEMNLINTMKLYIWTYEYFECSNCGTTLTFISDKQDDYIPEMIWEKKNENL